MKHTIPLELLELAKADYHLTVKSFFKDGEELTWVIDTGASKTVVDRTLSCCYEAETHDEGTEVRSAGIGTGSLDTSTGILHPFSLGDCPVPSLNVALIDLSHINDLYLHAASRKICGLIGCDFLLKHKAVVDYSRMVLILRTGKK